MAAIFALELKRLGHEVHFVYERELTDDQPSIATELQGHQIKTRHIVKMSSELIPGLRHPLSEYISQERFELVISSQLRDAAPAMAAAHRQRIKAVMMCMNLPHFSGSPVVKIIKHRVYQNAASKHADHVVVVAPAIEEELVKNFRVAAADITVIPCGLDIASIPAVDQGKVARLRVELGLQDASFVAVNLARIHRQKGQDLLLEALRKLSETKSLPVGFRMLFVGGPENDEGKRLMDQHIEATHRMGLDSYVRFVGFRDDYRNFLYIADAFILSSRWEGLPLVVLEAFAANVPVLMTEYGKRFDRFRQGVDGFYAPNENPAALAAAIARLMELSPVERKAIGKNGHDFLQKNLTLQSSLLKFGQLIDRVLAPSTSLTPSSVPST